MTDYKTMLKDLMKDGRPIKDVLDDIATAANELEQEKKKESKYAYFNGPVSRSADLVDSICKNKISLDTAACVLTYYLAHNLPGYIEACEAEDVNPVEVSRKHLTTLTKVAESFMKTAGKSDEEKIQKSLNGFFKMIRETINEAVAEEPKKVSPDKAVSDFLHRYGL